MRSFWSFSHWASMWRILADSAATSAEWDRFMRASYPQKAPRTYARAKSKYMPHQGKQEMARRVRQMEAANG